MTTYKLTYFDIDGGRAEPIRIAFHKAGVDFKDERIPFADFREARSKTRFNSVPVLEMDGHQVSQSNAIGRYIGKLADLYPEDTLQALYCDEVSDALEDLNHYIVQTFGLEGNELLQARQKLVSGWLSTYLVGLEALLQRGGGKYFADNRLTIADLKAYVQIRALCAGFLDHIPTDLVQRKAPSLLEHLKLIDNEPCVKSYYESRSKHGNV